MNIAVCNLVMLLLCAGCGVTVTRVDFVARPVEEPTKSWALEIAEVEAEKILKEFNSSDSEAVTRNGGPFHLDQYDREIVRGSLNLFVFYKLRVPVAFTGHPEHFVVSISEESGATQVSRGR